MSSSAHRAAVDRIAEAVLYEGYILYPYRPSVKNRQRWTFGGLYPEDYCQARGDGSVSSCQAECLVEGTAATGIETSTRFLHLTARQAAELLAPGPPPSATHTVPPHRPVEALRIGGRLYPTWQEAEERTVTPGPVALGALCQGVRATPFAFEGGRTVEPVCDDTGAVGGLLIRDQESIAGTIEESAAELAPGRYRLTIRIVNRTPAVDLTDRDGALLGALVSTHAVLRVRDGSFVSLLDPPASARVAAAECRNIGAWPVLVGEPGQRDTMLAAPIILYDYPQVAPESPGNFFDGTEIDEMLSLRIMTLTDDEKQVMAAVDDRAGDLLARTEALAREQLLGLHGTVRSFRPAPSATTPIVPEEDAHAPTSTSRS